jgi:putative aminopeptidase FrvX
MKDESEECISAASSLILLASSFAPIDSAALLDILRPILAQPTAPFHEDAVRAELLIQLAQIPSVTAEPDDFGNVIARYHGCSGHAEYAFAAHMDHPGYVGEEFLGGVPESYREKQPPLRDFGAFAMWDLPACEVRDGRIFSRACDDLIGCAAIIALFQKLSEAGAEPDVYGLFTRAEEVGFIGAIHLARSGLLPRDLTIISLECSSEKAPGAGHMGEGVIIRVGDRTSIFDDTATAGLVHAASEGKIAHQRCLMSGGTCEATPYQAYGYRTAALCVALGNYHNCGPDLTIAPEFVALDDVSGMIELMHRAATHEGPIDPHAALRVKFEKSAEKYARYH